MTDPESNVMEYKLQSNNWSCVSYLVGLVGDHNGHAVVAVLRGILNLGFLDGVEVIANLFVHAEHVHLGLLEYRLHLVVADDLPLVLGVLEVVGLYMCPETLDHTRPR
jgi:hypothetical protein